jgi:hypothetical protein
MINSLPSVGCAIEDGWCESVTMAIAVPVSWSRPQRLLQETFPAWVSAQRKSSALLGAAGVASLRGLADPRRRVTP